MDSVGDALRGTLALKGTLACQIFLLKTLLLALRMKGMENHH